MITVELRDVIVHAGHGIYAGEDKLEIPYLLNLEVRYEETGPVPDDISATADYERLYGIITARMKVLTGLLEKIADGIIGDIKQQYPFVTEVTISIHKLQAPIKNFQGTAGVRMNKKFNE